jgi:hypothetical protein
VTSSGSLVGSTSGHRAEAGAYTERLFVAFVVIPSASAPRHEPAFRSGGASDRSRINSAGCGWGGSSVYVWLLPMKHLIRHPVSSEKLRLLYGISVERALELDEAALKVLDLKANGQRAHLHKAVRRARKSAKARGAKTRRATAA